MSDPWNLLRRARRRLGQWLGMRLAAEWNELPPEVEASMLEWYGAMLQPGDLCFDIGANVGAYVQIFRRLGCKVVALEPQTTCYRALQRRFRTSAEVTLLQRAAASSAGDLVMHLGDAHTLSSLSTEWISRVSQTGRFGMLGWRGEERVVSVTLDSLIATYGVPRFIKIDVEGFEPEVLRGLSRPVHALSFEWTPECPEALTASLAHLATLGRLETNYSLGRFHFVRERWMSPDDLQVQLRAIPFEPQLHGDIYVRFLD